MNAVEPSRAITPPAGYADLTLCGAGATSHVFRAIDRKHDRVVALKRLHRHLARDAEAIARLRRELDALGRLRHPSIVPVRALIAWQRQPTIVMDFVDGEDLKARIVRAGRLPFEVTEKIGRALLGALATTHAAGIVHRDVKPQNVRLSSDGDVYLLDFGSARLDASSQLTTTGTTVGTPEYMAPELFAGSAYDPRVDIYGVGATLYECVTGRPPLCADSLAELAYQRATVDVPPVWSVESSVPEGLARLIDRCLRRAPEDRFASAARALWSLDHPEEERARVHRKSLQPPCIHCGTPLPRDAGFCPGCASERPFSYSPGDRTVKLTGVSDASRFVELVADRFPERARSGHLEALAQAALLSSTVQPVLVADIDKDQAAKLTADLAAVGAMTETKARPGLRKRMALSLLFSMVSVSVLWALLPLAWTLVFGVVLFGTGLLAQELMLARAPAGLLADRRSMVTARSVGLGTMAWAAGGVGLAFVPFAWMIAQIYRVESFFFVCFGALGVAAAVGLALLATGVIRSKTKGGARLDGQLSAGPNEWERWFVRTENGVLLPTQTRAVGLAAAVLVLGAFFIVPSELAVIKAMPNIYASAVGRGLPAYRPYYYPRGRDMLLRYRWDASGRAKFMWRASADRATAWRNYERASPVQRTFSTWNPAWHYVPSSPDARVPISYEPLRWGPLPSPEPPPGFGSSEGLRAAPLHLRWMVLRPTLPPFALSVFLLIGYAGLVRRKLRLRGEAKVILAAADPERLARAARRLPPLSRRSSRRLPAVGGDGFVGSALRHATDLDSGLSSEDATRMWGAIERLSAGSAKDGREERSLEARCILETDRDLQLRFEFLQLAGELETRAAQRWLTASLEATRGAGEEP